MFFKNALEARRDAALRDREAGFTLIELLVVVIIIGILAAIAIPIYIGVQNNAKDSAVKSDLVNAKTAIVAAATDFNGDIPSAVSAGTSSATGGSATVASSSTAVDLVKYGWSRSTNTTGLVYTTQTGPTATTSLWCVKGTSTTGKVFTISTNTQVAGGSTTSACPTNY